MFFEKQIRKLMWHKSHELRRGERAERREHQQVEKNDLDFHNFFFIWKSLKHKKHTKSRLKTE